MDKAIKLLGVKGYYRDISESVADNRTIMERYHELYRIEQAFRVSKSDLKTRPIFHFKEEPSDCICLSASCRWQYPNT